MSTKKLNGVPFIPAIKIGDNKLVNSAKYGFYLWDANRKARVVLTKEDYMELVRPIMEARAFCCGHVWPNNFESVGHFFRRASACYPVSFSECKRFYKNKALHSAYYEAMDYICNYMPHKREVLW